MTTLTLNRENFLFMCGLTNCNYPKENSCRNMLLLDSGNIYATNGHICGRLKNEYDADVKMTTILVTKDLIKFLKSKKAPNINLDFNDNGLVLSCEGEAHNLTTVEIGPCILNALNRFTDSKVDDTRILNVALNVKYLSRFLYGKQDFLSMTGAVGYPDMVKIKNGNLDFDGCIMRVREN